MKSFVALTYLALLVGAPLLSISQASAEKADFDNSFDRFELPFRSVRPAVGVRSQDDRGRGERKTPGVRPFLGKGQKGPAEKVQGAQPLARRAGGIRPQRGQAVSRAHRAAR